MQHFMLAFLHSRFNINCQFYIAHKQPQISCVIIINSMLFVLFSPNILMVLS